MDFRQKIIVHFQTIQIWNIAWNLKKCWIYGHICGKYVSEIRFQPYYMYENWTHKSSNFRQFWIKVLGFQTFKSMLVLRVAQTAVDSSNAKYLNTRKFLWRQTKISITNLKCILHWCDYCLNLLMYWLSNRTWIFKV